MKHPYLNKRRGFLLGLLVVLALPSSASSIPLVNADEVCEEPIPLQDKYRYLRTLSLDLTGMPPTMAQYEELSALEEVPEAWIDAMLDSDGFVQRFIRAHRKLIWNNIQTVQLLSAGARLRTNSGNFITNGSRSALYRGEAVPCLDEPLEVVDGVIQTTTVGGAELEGRRDVVPFWDLNTTVSVCGFNAQENLFSPTGTDCSTPDSRSDPGCGCGPNLQWCGRGDDIRVILESFGESVEKTLEYLITEDKPYTELFTTRVAYVNGPLVHYWKHWPGMSQGIRNVPRPLDLVQLPELPFSAVDTWVQITLPEHHAGILTSPAYLLRFQTNRGRASQFYTKFLCKPFQPPSGALPVADEAALNEPNLQLRAGCKYCHAVLEPTAAYWGRWPQSGAGYLGTENFPINSDECLLCATTGASCPDDCSRYYHTVSLSSSDEEFLGMLGSLLFLRPEHHTNVEEGPELLAMKAIATNELPRCTAQTAAETLIGRQLSIEEEGLLEDWVREFASSGYSYRTLIKIIVTHSLYRRVQ